MKQRDAPDGLCAACLVMVASGDEPTGSPSDDMRVPTQSIPPGLATLGKADRPGPDDETILQATAAALHDAPTIVGEVVSDSTTLAHVADSANHPSSMAARSVGVDGKLGDYELIDGDRARRHGRCHAGAADEPQSDRGP